MESLLPLPSAPPEAVIEHLRAFSTSSVIRSLWDAWDLPEITSTGLAATLLEMERASEVWDSRKGRERNLSGFIEMTRHQAEVALVAADALGMTTSSVPVHREVDYLLVLGGLVRACFNRPVYAKALIEGGLVVNGAVVGLGGFREIAGNEIGMVRNLGIPVDNEFDAMEAGMRQAFNLQTQPEEQAWRSSEIGGSWAVRKWAGSQPELWVAAAPSCEPSLRRANTADTYRWFAEELVALAPSSSVAIVTSAIYRHFQHADAIRMLALQFGCSVETVGVDTNKLDPPFGNEFESRHYLQEVRSTIRSFRLLADELGRRGFSFS